MNESQELMKKMYVSQHFSFVINNLVNKCGFCELVTFYCLKLTFFGGHVSVIKSNKK